ncbi:hypothetical protein KPL70_021252 [Citrus sinensis]|nr:hypothetical protein KPL70_021252 [Citrus sinensis]
MNALFCALDKKEFHRVSSCESANEIWHKLEVVYEGTNQVKESKISRYTRQYELFQMEQNESVYSMYTRFTDIVNTLGALGKIFSNSEKVKKIIRSLPKEWRPKRTAIEEAKDLNTLPLDDLIGSLISYEEDLAAEKGHGEKKKSIALKASKYESDVESEPDDEELAMLARRFRKFFKKTGERRNFKNFKNQREKKGVITCYECKKPGHIRSECPLIKKFKKKAMVATWDDSEEDSSDEEGLQEVSNLALMAIGGDDDLNEGLKKKKNKWYLDSGCSRHMTGNYAWFSSFTKIENGGEVSFGDNSKGKILGFGNVDNLGKFDPKSDVGIFLGYSNSSKAYRVYNKRSLVVEESMHVTFNESNPSSAEKGVANDDADGELQEESSKENQENAPQENQEDGQEEQTNMELEQQDGISQTLPKEWRHKSVPPRNPIPPREVSEFASIHFPTPSLAKRFEDRFDGQKEPAFDFDDRVYPNLVRVFYSNMEISDTCPNRIVTQVSRVPIEFDDADLADFLGISSEGHNIYTSRKALSFDSFCHTDGVRNICRHRDLSDEICLLPFWSQLLSLQIRILHTNLQHIVTPRKGHSDEVTRLDVGLLDSLLTDRPINLGYVIVRHMLSTPAVNHRLLPYGSIITKILRCFEVPLLDTGHIETRRIGPEAMNSIGFSRKNGEWIKTSNSKNRDTLIAPEDDRMLNDIYPPDQLPNFRLGAHPHPPCRRFVPRPPTDSDSQERAMDADIPSSSKPPPTPEPFAVPEQPSASMSPPAPVQPPASDVVQQLITDVHRISERQQLILDRVDSISRGHQQLRSDFQTFQ